MLVAITIILSSSLLVICQNDSISGDGSGMFNSSISLLNPTSTIGVIVASSTSAAGNINPSPLIGAISDYINSEQSHLFVGMVLLLNCVLLSW